MFQFDLNGYDVKENPLVLAKGDIGIRAYMCGSKYKSLLTEIVFTPEAAEKFGIKKGHRVTVRESFDKKSYVLINEGPVKKRIGHVVCQQKNSNQLTVKFSNGINEKMNLKRVNKSFGTWLCRNAVKLEFEDV